MPKPNKVEAALKRVDKREAKFPRADQRRVTANLEAASYEALRIAVATKRKPAGKIIDELIEGYIHKIKEDKPAYLK